MATFDYTQARADALELIEFFGGKGQVILKGSAGGYDAKGNLTPDTDDIIYEGYITPLIGYKTAEIDGTAIQRGDNYVLFHSDDKPLISMTVTLGGEAFRIINVTTLSSITDITVITKLQLRK